MVFSVQPVTLSLYCVHNSGGFKLRGIVAEMEFRHRQELHCAAMDFLQSCIECGPCSVPLKSGGRAYFLHSLDLGNFFVPLIQGHLVPRPAGFETFLWVTGGLCHAPGAHPVTHENLSLLVWVAIGIGF
jgi:hypothetical protein